MNKSKSKIIIIISIILVILIIGILSFLLIYTKTDLLKSNKQLFFKYAMQIENEKSEENKISEYFQKKKQQSYNNEGEISVNVSVPDLDEEYIEQANEVNITFDGCVDNANNKNEQNIKLNYSDDVGFGISYRKDDDIYGLQSEYIGSKYIAIENNNLKELFEKLGIQDTENIPDKIQLEQLQTIEFSEEEKEIIKEKYGNIFETQLTEEQFKKIENGEEISYTLEMTPEQFKSIVKQLLETLKTDDIILNKLNEFLENNYSSDEISIDDEKIDEIIEDIDETELTNNIKIIVSQKNSIFSKLEIQIEDTTLQIEKNQKEDSLEYNINCQVIEDENETEIYLNMKYEGLSNLENVKEIYTLGIKNTTEDEEMNYEYIYQNDIVFSNDVSIDSLDEENAIILNEQDEEYITNLFSAIGTRIQDVNKVHMEELEVEVNPIIYTNPITMSMYTMFNSLEQSMVESENEFDEAQEDEEQLLEDYEENFTSYIN